MLSDLWLLFPIFRCFTFLNVFEQNGINSWQAWRFNINIIIYRSGTMKKQWIFRQIYTTTKTMGIYWVHSQYNSWFVYSSHSLQFCNFQKHCDSNNVRNPLQFLDFKSENTCFILEEILYIYTILTVNLFTEVHILLFLDLRI